MASSNGHWKRWDGYYEYDPLPGYDYEHYTVQDWLESVVEDRRLSTQLLFLLISVPGVSSPSLDVLLPSLLSLI